MDSQIKVFKRIAPIMILFFIIAIVCVYFIFSPVKHITKSPTGDDVIGYPAISMQGLLDRAESWKEYPNYTIGLGIAAGLSFTGAIWSIAIIYRGAEDEEAN